MGINYQKVYKKAAKKYGGWSSKNKLDTTTTWGDFYEYVKKFLSGGEIILDVGSAEGNNFMRLSPFIKEGIGIDLEPAMIRLADKNRKNAGIRNIKFKVMDAHRLIFPKVSFDIVLNKHSPAYFKEIIKVLKPGGKFITQQVHETDKINIKKFFKRGQNYNTPAGTLLKSYKKEAKKAGFVDIKSSVSNIPYFFPTEENLVVFLSKTPVIPGFDVKNDYPVLKKFIEKNKSLKGIRSNTSRFFLMMAKPN